jgi:hypothetical protein
VLPVRGGSEKVKLPVSAGPHPWFCRLEISCAGQAPRNERKETQSDERRENRTEGNKATSGATEAKRLDQNRAREELDRHNDRNRNTTGQGAAPNKGNVSLNVTPEKRTKIHKFSSRSGTRLAWTAWTLIYRSAPLCPAQFASKDYLMAIEPSWRGFDYMVGDQIAIVDPRSAETGAIIDA